MSRITGLAERAQQWSRLESLLADAVAGRGRAVFLSGPVGGGKTALLHAFATHAGDGGARVVTATCSRAERTLAFGVVGQLLHGAGLPVDGTVRRLLADHPDPAANGAADDGAPELARILHALCRTVLDLAGEQPLLIGVDDAQHCDQPSLSWLLYLVRRLGPARVLLVLAETVTSVPAYSRLHDELLRHPHCERLDVPLLSRRGVADVADGQVDRRRARRFASAAYPLTGGNPLLVRALLDDDPDGVPGRNFRQAVLSCLHRGGPAVLATARALAVLGDDAGAVPPGRLTGAGADDVGAALEVLRRAGVLDGDRFRVPAIRAAALDDMPAASRAALQLAAARLLHDRGAPAADVAPYLLAAGDVAGDDSGWAVGVLAGAAEDAAHAERVALAVQYLDLAHRTASGERERAVLAARVAHVEWRLDPANAARRLPALDAALAAGHLTGLDAAALVAPMVWHGRAASARAALAAARDDPHAPGPVRAVELWVACTHPPALDQGQGQLRVASRESAGRAAGPELRAATALARVLTEVPGDEAVTEAEGVLQAARPSGAGTWGAESAVTALFALVYADRLETAESWCDRLLEESTVDGAPVGRALVTVLRAEVALRRGDLATALERGTAALELLPRSGWGTAVGLPLGCVVAAATRMGRHDTAGVHLGHPVDEAMMQSRHGLHYLYARGSHYLATDRHYAAVADFLACGELMSGWGMDIPGLVPWRTSAAAAWLHGGNRAEARRLLNEQLARLGPDVSRTRGTALRLLAATGQQRTRLPLLTEAASILAETGDQFELAHTLAELSRAHQELRDHRRAWSVARRAWHVANRCHAEELCAELLPGRARPAPAATGLAALTDAERRVAALAAVGYTNREIADKLFITPSTIEQHLTRVYRKLEVKYRKDLPAMLHSDLAGTP